MSNNVWFMLCLDGKVYIPYRNPATQRKDLEDNDKQVTGQVHQEISFNRNNNNAQSINQSLNQSE